MARLARVVIPGVAHHVTQRGNRRQEVFFRDEDSRAYGPAPGRRAVPGKARTACRARSPSAQARPKEEDKRIVPYGVPGPRDKLTLKKEILDNLNLPASVKINDCTLREADQVVSFSAEEKRKIAHKLDELGVHQIQAGIPGVSESDKTVIKRRFRGHHTHLLTRVKGAAAW